jgi:hypothetical protein
MRVDVVIVMGFIMGLGLAGEIDWILLYIFIPLIVLQTALTGLILLPRYSYYKSRYDESGKLPLRLFGSRAEEVLRSETVWKRACLGVMIAPWIAILVVLPLWLWAF